MAKMNRNEIVERLTAIKNGTMARIAYQSELPIKAEFKASGVIIVKSTETTGRFGVKYSNMAVVKATRSDPSYKPSTRANNNEWVVENKVLVNTKTGKEAVRFAVLPKKQANSKVSYFMVHNGVVTDFGSELPYEVSVMVRESYFTSHAPSVVKNVGIDNILFIQNRSHK